MPRLKNQPPKITCTKNGDCFVSIRGKKQYLGKKGAEGTLERYSEFVRRWTETNGNPPGFEKNDYKVCDVVAQYLDQAEGYTDYRDLHNFKTAAKYLVELYGGARI